MPGLVLPNSDFGWMRADAPDLDRKLKEGDGIMWSGDPRLFLSQGVVEETRGGRPTGRIVARRWEVWRDNEDGSTTIIGHWTMEEFDRILFDLAKMRAEAPGHENIVDVIERHERENEEARWKPGREALGEMMEHMAKLIHDKTEGKNVFRQMPGQNPDKQL